MNDERNFVRGYVCTWTLKAIHLFVDLKHKSRNGDRLCNSEMHIYQAIKLWEPDDLCTVRVDRYRGTFLPSYISIESKILYFINAFQSISVV